MVTNLKQGFLDHILGEHPVATHVHHQMPDVVADLLDDGSSGFAVALDGKPRQGLGQTLDRSGQGRAVCAHGSNL
jgi:hypothetical protein